MKAATVILEALKREGVDTIFGFPGGSGHPPLRRPLRLRHHDTSSSGTSRAPVTRPTATPGRPGKVGVCLATSGPGATNLVTAIANAYMDSVPMVAITGQVSRHLIGLDSFQEADITGITLPIVKHSYLVKDAESLPRIIREAFYIASTGRPGPVLIDIPVDVTKEEMDFDPAVIPTMDLPGYKPNLKGHPKQIKEAARLIATAERPVIYAGGGIIIVRRLGRAAGVGHLRPHPGHHHAHRQGRLPRRPRALHGHARHARHPVRQLRHEQGRPHHRGRACASTTGSPATWRRSRPRPASSTSIRTRPRSPRTWPWTCPSWATPRRCWRRCSSKLKKLDLSPDRHLPWMEQVEAWKRDHPLVVRDSEDGEIMPEAAIAKIWEVTRGEAIVCTEVGQHQMWAAQHYLCRQPAAVHHLGRPGHHGLRLSGRHRRAGGVARLARASTSPATAPSR